MLRRILPRSSFSFSFSFSVESEGRDEASSVVAVVGGSSAMESDARVVSMRPACSKAMFSPASSWGEETERCGSAEVVGVMRGYEDVWDSTGLLGCAPTPGEGCFLGPSNFRGGSSHDACALWKVEALCAAEGLVKKLSMSKSLGDACGIGVGC